jgi:EAL domain-containing protein (putative c-di-GMP-specific phosphodiesterase class I)
MTGLGCHFALDDFGSGLSSFAYLKNLNVSYLKIDGGFVRNMVNDRIDRAMVESINHVGHTLGIKTIAEFVETAEVLGAVSQLGVDYAQGYCIAKPVPIDDTFFRRDTSPVKGAKVS